MSTEMRKPVVTSEFESELNNWIDHKMQAVELINSIGSLLYNKSVELVLFRHTLVDESVSEVLKLHNTTQNFTNSPVSIYETNELAKELLKLDLAPSKIDIGKLASEWTLEEENFATKADFLSNKLDAMIGQEKSHLAPRDVILYGFGRIGRIAARELIKQAGKGQQLRLRAIVTRGDNEEALEKRAALLRNDSVHGAFNGVVDIDLKNRVLIIRICSR